VAMLDNKALPLNGRSLARREGHEVCEEPSDSRVDVRLVGLEGSATREGRGGAKRLRVRAW
jgi:hypothetical protein